MRYLLVNADDFGIGPQVSEGILDLAARGAVTSTVLLANSPHAEDAVRRWQSRGKVPEMGWHPSVTLDGPVLPTGRVPSLLRPDGQFWGLGEFVKRLWTGRIRTEELRAELSAQYRRCCELLGHPPSAVTTHHHVQIFHPVGALVREVVREQIPGPYMRMIREPWPMLWRVPGARVRRFVLNFLGRWESDRLPANGSPRNEWLIGVANPRVVHDPDFLVRWIRQVPGNLVELTCHPGLYDETPIGRDCTADDGMVQRRVIEFNLLSEPRFFEVCRSAGFTIVNVSQLQALRQGRDAHGV